MATVKKACKGTMSPKSSNVSSRLGSYGKKMKSGGALGMKSVKAGFDKNPGVTRADIIVAAKGEAKKGMKLKKQAATAIAMKKAGKTPKSMTMMKSGGKMKKANMGVTKLANMKKGGKMKKCAYGCK